MEQDGIGCAGLGPMRGWPHSGMFSEVVLFSANPILPLVQALSPSIGTSHPRGWWLTLLRLSLSLSVGLGLGLGGAVVPNLTAAENPKAKSRSLTLARENNWLIIRGAHLPKGEIRINYLEAYCRPHSTDADWHATTVGHRTESVSLSSNQKVMQLRCSVNDGTVVEHRIVAAEDEVRFEITARNPTRHPTEAHWAQPCIRLGDFTGYPTQGGDLDDYLPKCFLFLNGKLTRFNEVTPWAKQARYTPGQVWVPKDVPRTDANPRPMSPLVPSNGLIGCFNAEETELFAVAFNPSQELFQGVARCLHSDFRIGGLNPGQVKKIRGRIYLMPNNVPALLKRYARDFPQSSKQWRP